MLSDFQVSDNILALGENKSPIYVICSFLALASAIAIAYLGPKALFLPILLAVVYSSMKNEYFLAYLLLGLLPAISYLFWDLKAFIHYPLAVAVIFLWVVRKLMLRGRVIEFSPTLLVYIFLFMLAALVSSLHRGLTNDEMAALIRFTIFFSLIIALYDILKIKHILILITVLAIPLVLNLYFIYREYASSTDLLQFLLLYRVKPSGVFRNMNAYGGVVVAILPLWVSIAIWSRKPLLRATAILFSGLLTMGLLASNARAAFVGMFCAVVLFFIWLKRLRQLLAVSAAIAIILYAVPQFNAVINFAIRSEAGTTWRTEIWTGTFEIIRNNPLLGVGIGNYTEEFMPYFPTSGLRNFFKAIMHAHNQVLDKVAELGLAGIPLILALYYLPLRAALLALKLNKMNQNNKYIYGVIAGLVALYVRSMFEIGLLQEGSIYPEIAFWLLFILALKMQQKTKEDGSALFVEPAN